MASSVSQLNNYSNFSLFSFDNKDLLMKGMLMKQNAIDENRGKLQQIRDQVANFSVVKDVDKQYLNERITQTTDIINKYAGGDLSNPNLMNQLVSKFEEVVDDRVLNAVASASTRIRENKEWESKKGTPEYNEINRTHASQNYQKYLADPNVGAVYNGGGGFIKYVDNNAKLMSKESQEMLKNLGINAKYVQKEDGGYYFDYVNTYEGTTDRKRLRQAVSAIIGEEGMRQMDINAWAKYGNVDDPNTVNSLREGYNQLYETVNKSFGEERDILEGELKKMPEGKDKEEVKERIKELEEYLEENKTRNFDTEVVGADGTIDRSKYENLYKTYNRQVEFEQLTSLNYQPPRLVDTKVEDVKLNIRKYEESIRHAREMEQQGREGLMLRAEELALKRAKESPVPVGNGGVLNNQDILLGATEVIGEEERGEYNIFTREAEFQREAINGVNSLVGGIMGKGSTAKLVQDLTNVDIGSLKEIEIAGKKITINDKNRAQVYSALDAFKKTMIDGTTPARIAREDYSKLIQQTTADLVQHYKVSAREQKDLAFTKENFYFEKSSNGNYVYKNGLMPGAKTSNYKLLMYKASKGLKLTPVEELTLKTYTTRGIISDKGVKTTSWDKQQMYGALQEEITQKLGAKAVNTMPTYVQASMRRNAPSAMNGYGGDMIGGNENEFGSNRNVKYGFEQDTDISGLGWTDGWGNIGKTLNERASAISLKTKEAIDNKSTELSYTPINIIKGTKTAKFIETKYAINGNGVMQLYPEIVNGKVTGNWTLRREVTSGTGKDKVTKKEVVTRDGTEDAVTFTSKELGINAFDYYNSPYNTTLKSRAAVVELGSSGYNSYSKGDSRNSKPSPLLTSSLQYVRKQLSGSPEALQYLNSLEKDFYEGRLKFYVKPIEGSDTYHYVIKDNEGKEASVMDTGKEILSQGVDIPNFYNSAEQIKVEAFTTYIKNIFDLE